jgi:hypothetical protein
VGLLCVPDSSGSSSFVSFSWSIDVSSSEISDIPPPETFPGGVVDGFGGGFVGAPSTGREGDLL